MVMLNRLMLHSVLVCLLLGCLTAPAGAQNLSGSGDVFYAADSRLWHGVNDLLPNDSILFVLYSSGLQVMRIQPGFWSLDTLAELPLTCSYRRIVKDGDEILLFDSAGHLALVFAENPARPKLLAEISLSPAIYDLAFRPPFVYIASEFEGVWIYDLHQPDNPQLVKILSEPAHAVACQLYGNYLYVVDDYNGIFIYSWGKDPSRPVFLRSQLYTSQLKDLVIVGKRAFGANNEKGLVLMELADPAVPHFNGIYPTETRTERVESVNGYLFAADAFGNYEIYHPDSIGRRKYLPRGSLGDFPRMLREGSTDYLLAVDTADLGWIYRVDRKWNMRPLIALGEGGRLAGLAVSGKRVYIGCEGNPLIMAGIGGDYHLRTLGTLPPRADLLAGVGDLLAAADNFNRRLWLYRGDEAELLGVYEYPAPDGRAMMLCVDSYQDERYLAAIVFEEGIGFILWDQAGEVISAAMLQDEIDVTAALLQGTRLYLAGADRSGRVADLDDPAQPRWEGEFEWQDTIFALKMAEGRIYAGGNGTMAIYDLVDGIPCYSGRSAEVSGTVHDLSCRNGLIITALGEEGLAAYIEHEDGALQLADGVQTAGQADKLWFGEQLLLVADGSGLLLFEINDVDNFPAVPSELPSQLRVGFNFPNPFNAATELEVEFLKVPMENHVEAEVYNSLGQRVCRLAPLSSVSGRYRLVWDGCAENGEECSSGVYFFRIRAGNETGVRKMLLLR